MSPRWRWGLWLWAGLLASILCLFFLPLSPPWRWIAFLLVMLTGAVGIWRTGRQPSAALNDTRLDGLPPESYRLPVVLVCGDGLASLFGSGNLHQGAQGCWLRVDDISQLSPFTRQLLWRRPAWAAQLAVMVSVNPQQQTDERTLTTVLHELRWQRMQLRRETSCTLPVLLCSTVATCLANAPQWLSQQQAKPVTVWPTLTLPEPLAYWQRQGSNSQQAERVQQTVLFRHHHEWLQAQVLPVLQARHDDVACIVPQQVLLHHVAGLPGLKPASLWQQWLVTHTALTQVAGWHPAQAAEDTVRLPDFIFADLPVGGGVSSRQRTLRHAVTLLTGAVVLALCSSAWHNQQLLHRIVFDIRYYDSVDAKDPLAKAKAVEILRQHAAQLNDGFRNGEPLRLSLGLYQGERLRQPLLAAIKRYVPPLTSPTAPIAESVLHTVRLDSLSLFDTGKAVLKPGSTKVLVSALLNIKAKPGWLIVATGHTDSTGDAQTNQQLSLKRAEAVRDWMLHTSDVSPTCFAVQGYGASRPVVNNDTEAGRAANRRVEISLVPQADACQVADSPPALSAKDDALTQKMEK
ncbi:OmpA family protein [Serratia sp. JSRIV001]|uniref:OmpA family protein n=1 Tax=unclassified Serratia (in: enterobacteria) TaxID=2647522 RepID=UPI001CBD50A6|nr:MULTISPECIES: OmpA family protein [unclassified Serratia (in: enterobacteria)]UAN43948.1 OmpA family protein [Serratia sp. JSRIV001]UAN53540.1 OmpA family protein [Serratia sp. JSRIV002]UAN58161.1 OmpA family protein [Serratia sp. JSRIV004]